MNTSMKNLLIGLFVLIAGALIAGMILFLEPSVGDGKQTVLMRFSNINGIGVGTRVLFAGKPIGEVISIEQIPSARQQPTDELGQVYFYQLVLHVDSNAKIYTTDEFTIQTLGLLGEKSIAIIPRAPPKGVTPKRVTDKTPVYADSIDPLEMTINEISSLSEKMEDTIDRINHWIDEHGPALGCAIRSFDNVMQEAGKTIEAINQTELVYKVNDGVTSFTNTVDHMNALLNYFEQKGTFASFASAIRNIDLSSDDLRHITDRLNKGQGTLGKLFADDETYLRITAILSKADTLMNDINHYGLMFNMNKEWQRTRLKQITFLNALSTPQAFRDYFEREVDLINTTMSRLSMLVEKAENQPYREKVLESPSFQKDFAELMRLTQTLLDNLRLYNEELSNAKQ